MDSLTTAYLVCMLIGSVGSVVGAFVGNKIFPIESSTADPTKSVQTPEQPPVPSPQNTVQTQPAIVSASV